MGQRRGGLKRPDAFAAAPDEYARLRPGYPAEAARWLVPEASADVADIGAGTGQLTASLLGAGHRVVAVDPSPELLQRLGASLPGVRALVGTGEATGLDPRSVDAVAYGQSWHWVDAGRATAEAVRILRPRGWLAMAWNDLDTTVPWVADYQRAQRGLKARQTGRRLERSIAPEFQRRESAEFRWVRVMTKGECVALVSTFSFWLRASDAARSAKLAAVRAVLDAAHPGDDGVRVELPYVTRAYRYRLTRRATPAAG